MAVLLHERCFTKSVPERCPHVSFNTKPLHQQLGMQHKNANALQAEQAPTS